jgi:hypothetical protein
MGGVAGVLRIVRSKSGKYHQVEHVLGEGSSPTVTTLSAGHVKRSKAAEVANKLISSMRRNGIKLECV